MAEIEDGGPAHPVPTLYCDGLSVRDYLVGQALSGSAFKTGGESDKDRAFEWVVAHAESIADEYLRRRAKRMKGK